MAARGNIEWRSNGQAVWRTLENYACTGTPGYSGGCEGTYTDDYGSWASCGQCGGNGKINYWAYRRLPQWDAPSPPKGWSPEPEETILDRLYNGS